MDILDLRGKLLIDTLTQYLFIINKIFLDVIIILYG